MNSHKHSAVLWLFMAVPACGEYKALQREVSRDVPSFRIKCKYCVTSKWGEHHPWSKIGSAPVHSKIRNNSTTASYSKCGTNKAVITYRLETAKEFDLLTLNSCSGFFSRGVPLLSLAEINPQGLKFAVPFLHVFVQMWDPERQQCLC